MRKIPHTPTCVLCEPELPVRIVGFYLKRDGLCAIHKLEHDVDELYRAWEEAYQDWLADQQEQEFRRMIHEELHLDIERLKRACEIPWYQAAPDWIKQAVIAKYKELYGDVDFTI